MATQRRKKSRSNDEDASPKRKRSSSRSTSSAKAIPIDFSKAGEGGSKRYKEADYAFKFVGHKFGRSRDKDTPYVQVALEFTDGKYKGQIWDGMRTRMYLTDSSLWKIRSFLEAMGVTVPAKKANVNFAKYYGKELAVSVVDGDAYQGRISSEMGDFLDMDTYRGADEEDEEFDDEVEDDEEEDEDEEDEDDEDDDDEEDEEDIEDMDVDEDL
jgi:hypothetical protein